MKRNLFFPVVILLATLVTGCDNYARHPIDEIPAIKPDASLLGIWKPVADKNPTAYVLIQNCTDIFNPGGKNIVDRDEGGKYGDYKSYNYYITQVEEAEGKTHYEEWIGYLSNINGALFLNLSASSIQAPNDDSDDTQGGGEKYFFVRLLGMNESRNVITSVMVQDTLMQGLRNAREVRSYIASHMYQHSFYGDTTRFYKVSGYHTSLGQSMAIANPGKYKK